MIGHRGASGFLPEHTLQSYRLAIRLGADYIEPDLVATKDGVLIARHEPIIGDSDPDTTGDSTTLGTPSSIPSSRVARRPGMSTAWRPPASSHRTSRSRRSRRCGARQTRGGRPTEFNGKFKIPTLQEVIDLVKRQSRRHGRQIGIYPETKHPTFHNDLGLPLEGPARQGAEAQRAEQAQTRAVFIQSFEQSNLSS